MSVHKRALLLLVGALIAFAALAPAAWAAPANDDFSAAQTLSPGLPREFSGSTQEATKQAGEPSHAGNAGGHSVWFSWTPAVSGPVAINSGCFPGFEMLTAVYTGSTVDGLTPVASNQGLPAPSCFGEGPKVEFTADAGTTYWIAIDGRDGAQGSFSATLEGTPVNDDFADAAAIGGELAQQAFGTTRFATPQTDEPDHAGEPASRSVWFSWTPAVSGPVAISTCSSFYSLDTVLAVYTGSAVDGLTPVMANDDAPATEGSPGCASANSEVRLTVAAGTSYKIAVDSVGGTSGRFELRLHGRPANDDFANAQALPATLNPSFPIGTSQATTEMATKQAGEPNHAGAPGGQSIWFSWTPTSSGRVLVSTCTHEGPDPDTLLAVYTGAAVDALTPVGSNDDGAGTNCLASSSEVGFTAVAGATYWIAVDSKGPSRHRFDLQLQGAPANDDFAGAQTLAPALPSFATGSTRFTTKQVGEPNHSGEPGGHSAWFSWTPTDSGQVIITACPYTESIVPVLGVYTGSAVDALTPVAGESIRGASCRATASGYEFDAVAGTTYRIAVDGKGGGIGRFGLAFERGPANDDFSAPQSLSTGLPSYGSAVTKLATKQAGEPDHAGDAGGHSVWYSWTPASSGQVAVSTCAYYGALDPTVAIYTGSALNSLTPVASADDDPGGGCRGAGSEAQFSAVAGTTYRIAVDGKGGSSGGFQLILEGVSANDDFGHSVSLGGGLPSRNFFASNRFATKQAGEPNHAGNAGGASVWFKWTAPVSAEVSIDTCGSGFDTLLGVYTGAVVNALTPVAVNDDAGGKCSPRSRVGFAAIANTTYRIAVDGKDGAQGAIRLNIDARPTNDDFESAAKVQSPIGWYWSGTTSLATKQAGEPDHAGDAGGHSVWYSWTAGKSAAVELDACGSSFVPLLGVYTGAAVNALTPVATSDSGLGQCDEGGSIGFDAVAGTTYRIAVDGAGGDNGYFDLHLRPAVEHPRSLEISSAGAGSGSVISPQADVACASLCSFDFEVGESVALTAHPAAGSTFAGWSGGGCSGTGPCEVTLNANIAVVANFASPAAGGGGGDVVPPAPGGSSPGPPAPRPKPIHCKPKFKKVRVHGKAKCVKKKDQRAGKKGGRHGSGR